MEWIETTGKTVDEARAAALERLGVAETDAEIIVLEEPERRGLLRRQTEARVRVRVRPVQARAKRPARRRTGSDEGRGRANRQGGSRSSGASRSSTPAETQAARGNGRSRTKKAATSSTKTTPAPTETAPSADQGDETAAASGAAGGRSGSSRRRRRGTGSGGQNGASTRTERVEEEEMSIEAQAEMAESFVKGVVERFGFASATTTVTVEEDAIHVAVDGEGLGLLIGSRGSTVDALQELTRTVVHRKVDEHGNRLHVDVGGYRARRTAALQDFARRIAAEVLETGEAQRLDPMPAPDRKVVHDAVNEVAGVVTSSEGEEPRRFIVVSPASASESTELFVDQADEDLEDVEPDEVPDVD